MLFVFRGVLDSRFMLTLTQFEVAEGNFEGSLHFLDDFNRIGFQ